MTDTTEPDYCSDCERARIAVKLPQAALDAWMDYEPPEVRHISSALRHAFMSGYLAATPQPMGEDAVERARVLNMIADAEAVGGQSAMVRLDDLRAILAPQPMGEDEALARAREAVADYELAEGFPGYAERVRAGSADGDDRIDIVKRALMRISQTQPTSTDALQEAREALRESAERLSIEAQISDANLAGARLRRKMGLIASDLFAALAKLDTAEKGDGE